MLIAVVVASYRRPACLGRCLASLGGQRRAPDEVIVVGQGNDAETAAVFESAREQGWRYIHIPSPNIVKAENAGVAAATADVVAFIDDDAEAPAGWLATLERWYEDTTVGGVGGPYIEHDDDEPSWARARDVGRYKWYGRYVSRQWCLTAEPRYVDALSGSNMSFRRDLIPLIPSAFRPYWNAFEIFICGAARRCGRKIVFDPAAYVNHYRGSGKRHYEFRYKTERNLRRRLYLANAHNFVFATLIHGLPPSALLFLAYEFMIGDSGRPGVARAVLMLFDGRSRDAWEGLGPSLGGRLAGLLTFVKTKIRARGDASRRETAGRGADRLAFTGSHPREGV